MTAPIADLVHQQSATTGTGNLTLTTVFGKQNFNAIWGNGGSTPLFFYFITNQAAAEFEFGLGHLSTSSTLVRDSVLGGSNGTSPVSFSAGVKDVTNDYPSSQQLIFPISSGRLTLTSGLPVTSADVTGATTVYFTPYNGNQIGLYNGVFWNNRILAEISIKLTDAQTGTRASTGNGIITGLTDTSQFIVGMKVSGTGIGAANTIASIDSATQVTLTVNNTATGTATVTFKMPAGLNYDVFAYDNSGTVKLEVWAWTNDTTRAAVTTFQDGIEVLSGRLTSRLVGTVRTTAVDGQTEDSLSHRYVSNKNNAVPRDMVANDATSSWTYSTTAYRQAHANAANQLDFVTCEARFVAAYVAQVSSNSTTGATLVAGIGINSTTVDSSKTRQTAGITSTSATFNARCEWTGYVAIGRNFIAWLELSNPNAGMSTFYGTVSGSALSGIGGVIMA